VVERRRNRRMIGASFDPSKTRLQELLPRADALLERIEAATVKRIARDPVLFRTGVVAEAHDEGPAQCDPEEPLGEVAS
jgi:hypothetical protein